MSLLGYYLLFALLVTIVVEVAVAVLFGYRKKYEIAAVILVNLITNPILNYSIILTSQNNLSNYIDTNLYFGLLLFSELVVIVIEWLLLRFALRNKSKKLLVLTIVMNICSLVLGAAIPAIVANLIQ